MENSYKVERNVPLPVIPRGAPSSPVKYPWAELMVGDCFFIPLVDRTAISIRGSITIDLKKYQNESGNKIKITTRTMDNGIRIWRIK